MYSLARKRGKRETVGACHAVGGFFICLLHVGVAMSDNPTNTPYSVEAASLPEVGYDPIAPLRQEYEEQQALFSAQPPIIQRFLEAQARQLADAMLQKLPQIRFTLPDRVVTDVPAQGFGPVTPVAAESREQIAGGLLDRLTRTEPAAAVRQRLAELMGSADEGIATAAELVRHATAMHMVHGMLPAGRPVTYVAEEGEVIPTRPAGPSGESAVTAATDAIVEEEERAADRETLLTPYVPAARRFFMPQWVIFDDEGRLLVNTEAEAEARVASMQRFVSVLHASVALAPYMVADEEYQRKRYGILGQLINQGRVLARFQTQEIVEIIQQRAASQDLNRGLSLSLPYFDDQELEMRTHDFTVIPPGRIMFVPAFVVRAAREEQAKVAQDTRLSPSTRKHLLSELANLEHAFHSSRNG